ARYPVPPHLRTAGCHFSLDLDQILERDRDPVQRADLVPRADRLVCRFCSKPRLPFVNLNKGVELPVLGTDSLKERVNQIDRRKTTSTDLQRQDVGGW